MCGIVGFSGNKLEDNVRDLYNVENIKTLMYYNSVERFSTDSSGFYHPELKSPVKSISSAKDMFKSIWYNGLLTMQSLFIGHVRSKSVGAVTAVNAHPYQLNNLIGVHNGTISNYKDLLRIFKVPVIEDKTDSYYLYQCIAKEGNPEPIRYIEGSAALLFTDKLDPTTLYVYRKSRELHYGIKDEGMYISSEASALVLINCRDIKEFDEDVLYRITDGFIEEEVAIKTMPKVDKHDSNPILFDRWIMASMDKENLVKDSWYLVESTIWETGKIAFAILKRGMLADGQVLSAKNTVKIPIENFNLNFDFNYYSSAATGRLMICMEDINIDSKDKKSLVKVFDEGSMVTIYDVDVQKRLFSAADLVNGREITHIPYVMLRVCTPEEEQIVRDALIDYSEDVPEELKRIKFSTKPVTVEASRLVDFAEELQEILENKDNSTMTTKLAAIKEKILTTIELVQCEE